MPMSSPRQEFDGHLCAHRSPIDQTPPPDADPAELNSAAGRAIVEGRLLDALELLRRAIAAKPDSPELHSNLGRLLRDLGRFEEALAHAAQACRLDGAFIPALVNLASILIALNRDIDAETCLQEALRLDPLDIPALALLGGLLESRGDAEAADAAYRRVLELDPEHAGVLARRATRLRSTLPTEERATLERLVDDPARPLEARRKLAFGHAHLLESEGRHAEAEDRLARANSLRRLELSRRGRLYDRSAHHEIVSSLIDVYDSKFLERLIDAGDPSATPVFVVGLPRTGTTLVEQILAAHPRIHGAGELTLVERTAAKLPLAGRSLGERVGALDRERLGFLAREHLECLRRLAPSADRIVDKMPENYLHLGLIAALFPRATLIHCRRDLRDVALSCWMTDFGMVRWACDLDDMHSRFSEYVRLIEHWRGMLGMRIFDIEYESLVRNPEPNVRRLLAACGVSYDPACLEFHRSRRFVASASTTQVRRPISSASVGRHRFHPDLLARFGDLAKPTTS
ncbi:MAG: sulfotransferase [Isosphaeraceae bacterium]|nr:sulfotransferase [Isosphaeraceae bacterium]